MLMDWIKRLNPVALIGWVLIVYLVLVLVQIIKHNYDLRAQINQLQGQITDLQNQQGQLKYELQYYQTESFQEKEARAKLGLQAPGEHVIVLPRPKASAVPSAPAAPQPHKSNLQQWREFLFG
jgi:cell division protein FtsL